MGRRLLIVRLVGRAAIACGLGVGLRPSLCEAQISPGKLSKSHAALEGSPHCAKCHDARHGLPAPRCLACHLALQQRLVAGLGLHAKPTHSDCKRCHVEHQGVEYDLVWWGKAGRQALDHRDVGYALEGKHARLDCEACHQGRFQKRTWEPGEGVNAARTYLGLPTACLACHKDEHRGTRFAARDCVLCHTLEAWKPAPRFDHAKTGYPLTGRHTALACARCHAVKATDGAGRPGDRKAGAPSRECASCHEDVHGGKLGSACASCHSTADWRRVDRARFDHERTAYPLRGRHTTVACDACHASGRPLRLAHGRCTDCHADAHLGQLAQRADQGRCESCHDVSGFAPAAFPLEAHQKTRYPLEGAHLAVACDACHRRVAPQILRALPGLRLALAGERGARPTLQLRFAATRCADCHRDAHAGELDRHVRAGGCESCHRVEAWRQVTFDHQQTRFALAGGHAKRACSACHKPTEPGTPRQRTRLAGTPLACEACHHDPHHGQFARQGSAACESCHNKDDVKAARFDHNRDSAYPLDGAHARVACSACHRRETSNGVSFVRYKPLGRACKDCHAVSRVAAKEAS